MDLYGRSLRQKAHQFGREEWPHHPLIDDYRRYCGTDQVSDEQAFRAIRTYYALCSFMDAQVGGVRRP